MFTMKQNRLAPPLAGRLRNVVALTLSCSPPLALSASVTSTMVHTTLFTLVAGLIEPTPAGWLLACSRSANYRAAAHTIFRQLRTFLRPRFLRAPQQGEQDTPLQCRMQQKGWSLGDWK